ncbi:MAG: PP2C family protein-serine/threonine phosphatase [Anaerolineales bacterium]
MPVRIEAVAVTHIGRMREINQDSVYERVVQTAAGESIGLLLVADGVGGHKAGQIASQLTVESIRRALGDVFGDADANVTKPLRDIATLEAVRRPAEYFEDRLRRAVEKANLTLFEYAVNHREAAGNMGSTVTGVLLKGSLAVGANVGDSRTYLFSGDELHQLTQDHSLVAQMIAAGQLPAQAVYDHPQRNVITRSLGNAELVQIDTWQRQLQPGDTLLLCSDGLWELLGDDSLIANALRSNELPAAVDSLIEAANAAGGTDNIGVVAAHLHWD